MSEKKKVFEVVLTTGKSARALKRLAEKYNIMKQGIGSSPLGKMRSRQERKAMAKSLKVPFQPRYNGEFTQMKFSLITAKNKKYTKLVLAVK
jgi:hypothetical protein